MSLRAGRLILIGAVLAVAAIVCVCALMADHDYRLVASGKEPRFTFSRIPYGDGGSIEYRGIGYRVTAMHRIVPYVRLTGQETGALFRIGPELDYWIPVPGRDGTTTNFIPYPTR